MFSATSLGLVVTMSLSWYFSPAGGIRNLAIWTSVSLSPPWEIRAYPSRTSPRYIMYSHQRSESVSSMSCREKLASFRNEQPRKYISLYQRSLCTGQSPVAISLELAGFTRFSHYGIFGKEDTLARHTEIFGIFFPGITVLSDFSPGIFG